MTYRIDIGDGAAGRTLEFQGLLDRGAIEEIRRRAERARAPVRVVLRAGTEVAAGALPALRAIDGLSVVAESPFLSRWLSEDLP
jgi:hypothetical protein